MCGICGYLGNPEGIDTEAMMAALAHRGPDGHGEFRRPTKDGELWLGHTRLAILDLSPTGAQPMSTSDGVHTIVYNGEIYNHRRLREDLRSRGYEFRGTSDTEVLLYLLREYGIAGIDRLRGMFAFAFWDASTQELLLARDPFGIKPLYYVDHPRRLAFSSEMRPLLRGRIAEPIVSPDGLESYLAFGCVSQPHTILRDVRCLAPGSLLRRQAGYHPRMGRHYTFPSPPTDSPHTYEEAVARTGGTLRRVVAEHMMADVPVGILLSGGIDSSGLVAMLAGQQQTVDTFSVIFAGEDESMSERPFSGEVARTFQSRHHEVLVHENIVDLAREAVTHLDRPSIDGPNTYVVCKAVRGAGITVVQSGLGADEVFLGYGNQGMFTQLRRLSPALGLWPFRVGLQFFGRLNWDASSYRLGKALAYLGTQGTCKDAYAAVRGLFPRPAVEALLGRVVGPASAFVTELPGASWLDKTSQLSALEVANYMSNMLLRDSDVMSMAHSLELRVPYLDRDLVEEVSALPVNLKQRDGRQKPLLVDSLQPPLPRMIVERRKQGFVLPFARWLRTDLYAEVAEVLSKPSCLEAAGLDRRAVAAVWRRYTTRRDDTSWTRPWSLYVLVRWLESLGE